MKIRWKTKTESREFFLEKKRLIKKYENESNEEYRDKKINYRILKKKQEKLEGKY